MASEKSYRCPSCGYEYQPWVKVCPDCGKAIEERPNLELIKGKLEPDVNPRWTIVTNVPNAIIGNFIKSQIEDAGIPVLMFRSRSADIAEFSHNDYVPQDLLVPLHLVREARRLLDSPPGDFYGPRLLPDEDWDEDWDEESGEGRDDQDAQSSEDMEARAASSTLPEGWQMLPSEADLDARQAVRRSHGSVLRGWYWSDGHAAELGAHSDQMNATGGNEGPNPEYDDFEDYPFEDYPVRDRVSAHQQGSDQRGNEWPSRNKWNRIVYGVLLMVMSLPFLIQLLRHLFEIIGFGR